MGVDVQYRDLPGGTRRLRFADELPRRLMCGTCGMLSMLMLEDKQGHAFCNVCVGQKSQAAAIFCEYEKRNVSLDEDHYLQCERTEIECGQCQQRIRGCHWRSHLRNCPRKIVQCRYCVTAFPQIDLQTHEVLCTENPNRIASPTAQQSLLRNASALPVSGDRSEYAFSDNAEHHESSNTASEEDDAGIQFWSLSIRHLQNHLLTCLAIVGNFPIVSFFRRNAFARNLGFPLFAIVYLSLLARRRINQ